MAQKYPNDEVPYRFRREKPRRSCCISSTGLAKGSWANWETVEKFIKKNNLRRTMEAYPCEIHDGRWHIRKIK